MRRTTLGPLALALALALGGCAASTKLSPASATPSSPVAGREEMASLELEIADSRSALGLPARPDLADRAGAEGTATRGALAPGQPGAPAEPTSTALAPPPTVASERRELDESAGKQQTCTGPCRYSRAICAAAERICAIARYLQDEDADRRCRRAREDCQEARRATGGACPGC